MEIEITFDPKWEAACSGLAMDKDHEVMPDGDWIRFARRVTGIQDLFMYHHRTRDTYVLAKWVYKPDICLELEAFQLPPDRGGWMSAEELKARCRPVQETVEEMHRKMKQAGNERRSMMSDHAHEKQSVVKRLRNNGNERSAYMIENGYTPWVGEAKGGESYRQTCEMLKNLAKVT